MQVRVRFHFNKITGEVEEFLVEQDSGLAHAQHNREHDRVASEIGRAFERHPAIEEVLSGGIVPSPPETGPSEPERESEAETPSKEKRKS